MSWGCTGGIKIGKLLVYYDGSESSEKALWKAEDIMDTEQDEILLLSVIPDVKIEGFEDVDDDTKRNLKASVEKIMGVLKARNIKCKNFLEHGNIVDIIVNMAQYFEVDLVIIADKGDEKLSPFTMGSVSEQVSKQVHRPILTVK